MVDKEALKLMPFGEVWDEYCRRQNKPLEGEWFKTVKEYEKTVLLNRK